MKNGTWQTPTLTVLRGVAHMGDPEMMNDPRMRDVPPPMAQYWQSAAGRVTPGSGPERKREFDNQIALVGAMHKAGVKILAGTDTPNPYVFAGSSLHDELQLLVKAGLPPIEALRAATLRPAEYFGMSASLGSIVPGKLADLVLLAADPSTDIANTRRVEAVVLNGKLFRKP